jgi:signal recognition particle subunit SRP54
MFENLTARLSATLRGISGKARLTEENIADALREVRMALLEADVALSVTRDFTNRVRERALGREVTASLTPGQVFVGVVHEELKRTLGDGSEGLLLTGPPPAIVLMAGLQGAGKTTTVAKLARWLKESQRKRVLVASVDVYRPAAITQLQTLAAAVGVDMAPAEVHEKPLDIAARALALAKARLCDVLIVDTAGRLHVDADMMAEIRALHAALSPAETLFVVDAMTGQDAAQTARAFGDALPLTGVVLAKADGDARGGAALSVREITGRPIKFIGVGEKTEALEVFHPDRIASRILGMGDVLSLIEDAQQKVDRDEADRLAKKLAKGKRFDLADMKGQLRQMRAMGGVGAMLDKLPGMGGLSGMAESALDDRSLVHMEAIIDSMTRKERRFPDLINGSRKRRIAAGSGTDIADVNRLLKQYKAMEKMMRKLSSQGGMAKLMRGLQGMAQARQGMGMRRR